jgi:ribokinase
VLDATDVLVVNEIEAAMAAGLGAGEASEPQALASDLASRHDLTCVVTLGAAGAIAQTPAGGWRIGALPVEPVDTTGAGDAFVGVLAAALDQGLELPDALRRASVAAGLACTRLGAQTSQPTAAEIEARLPDLAPATPLD